MKRQIMTMMLALPLGVISLLPKSASAADIHPQFNSSVHPPVIVAQTWRRNEHRVWVQGHWEREPNGHRRWVPGHWVYRR